MGRNTAIAVVAGAAVLAGGALLLGAGGSASAEPKPAPGPAPAPGGGGGIDIAAVQTELNSYLSAAGYVLLDVDGKLGKRTCGATQWAANAHPDNVSDAVHHVASSCSPAEPPHMATGNQSAPSGVADAALAWVAAYYQEAHGGSYAPLTDCVATQTAISELLDAGLGDTIPSDVWTYHNTECV